MNEKQYHALYRFFAADGTLLYIGLTMNPGTRWKAHSKDKPWWTEVANVTVEVYPDRRSVEAAEVSAIKSEKPKYNIAHRIGAQPTQPSRSVRVVSRSTRPAGGGWVSDPTPEECAADPLFGIRASGRVWAYRN